MKSKSPVNVLNKSEVHEINCEVLDNNCEVLENKCEVQTQITIRASEELHVANLAYIEPVSFSTSVILMFYLDM